ncbi:MAG: DUF1553 domain-containing protein [Pirellulaceae bacterium]|nr:DUF1553 domain-containing protein [Pirellulaceae bacterium]
MRQYLIARFNSLAIPFFFASWLIGTATSSGQGQTDDRAAEFPNDPVLLEFFENRIRPVLVQHCYECHNSHGTSEGGLTLDHALGLRKGGDGGPTIDLSLPATSRLLQSIRHELDGYEMPAGRPQLPDDVAADFERWIATGAKDPRSEPPTAEQHAAQAAWPEVRQRRLSEWAFQPIRRPELPQGSAHSQPIDVLVADKLQSQNLAPAPPASATSLVRRLFIVLIGLPPTSDQAKYWTQQLQQTDSSDRQRAYERLLDELLASPHYGERWARHWMDWIRYAESHGSEGDPSIVNAHLYRDYLIRGLNQDVPYDQLVREHVAGDLLEEPRLNHELGLNESRLATAHWRMVFHGFSPTDALDEQVRFIDDQINVFSKAFLGLTVSCARCHDHKFDPIGQDDYYALYGIMRSNRPARQVVNQISSLPTQVAALADLKPQIRAALSKDWLADKSSIASKLNELAEAKSTVAETVPGFDLLVRGAQAQKQGRLVSEFWQAERQTWQEFVAATSVEADSQQEISNWLANSTELPTTRQKAGEFAISAEPALALVGIYPAGYYSHGLSAKLAARLTSTNLQLTVPQNMWLQVIGDRDASLRYVVRDYPRDGTIYPIERLNGQAWRWQRFDMTYWVGDLVHIELAHAQDAPLLVAGQERSWFGIRSARMVPAGAPPPPQVADETNGAVVDAGGDKTPQTVAELVSVYEQAICQAIEDWSNDTLTDGQALLLDAALKQNLLVNQPELLATAQPLLTQYQAQEREIEVPVRTPGLVEAEVADQAMYVRGDHRRPGEVVPRRFLSLVDSSPYQGAGSGRRQLAEDLLRADNPLTRRVIVNRLWHHLFGRGLVATPDNFGKLGSEPTHPELLDWMADRFTAEHHWSLKQMIREIVLSETWQRDSAIAHDSQTHDPEQRYLASFPIRRFEAEAIRDTLLHTASRLELEPLGPAANDPLHRRRSIYSAVRRNSLDPFLRVFDFPEPSSAVGRRDVTAVPAQSLTMLNAPLVRQTADRLAEQLISDPSIADDRQRLTELYWRCFARAPNERELESSLDYMQRIRAAQQQTKQMWDQLQERQTKLRADLTAVLSPIRERLTGERDRATADLWAANEPIARWSFSKGYQDLVGSAHGKLEGSAIIKDGALVLDGNGYLVSAPLSRELSAKTMEAWVQLSDLTQQGGGVMTVQTPDGNLFDSIVFGEQQVGHWLPGSNGFSRTQPLAGKLETEAVSEVVHFAIVYQSDGVIQAYRNGQPYGSPYQSSGVLKLAANEAVVTIGLRHLPGSGGRFLRGRVYEARLYDKALSAAEISVSFQSGSGTVAWPELLAELSTADRTRVEAWQLELQELEQQAAELVSDPVGLEPVAAWSELVQSLFMSVEFITIR